LIFCSGVICEGNTDDSDLIEFQVVFVKGYVDLKYILSITDRAIFRHRWMGVFRCVDCSFLLEYKIMSKLIDLQSQIANLQKQAEEIRSKEFEATIVEIRQKMQAFGITVKDLQSAKIKSKAGRKPKVGAAAKPVKVKKAGAAVAAKYRGPNGETWSGRGLTPKWLASLIAAGSAKEQYLITA
jgi:DNA-binding protein H-NS